MRCCICLDNRIDDPYGHNAEPVASGRCCDYCNGTVVVPERFKRVVLQRHADETRRIFKEKKRNLFGIGSLVEVIAPEPETLARSGDRETSHRAARSIKPTAGMLRVLSLFKQQGEWTDRDGNIAYAEMHGGAEGTFRKRRNDLVTQGLVMDSGRCEDGRKHTVWVLTDDGIQVEDSKS